jgi:WD40 repeat protein
VSELVNSDACPRPTTQDCVGRVWDLRSGKCILVLQGHVKQILGIDFNPTGYQVHYEHFVAQLVFSTNVQETEKIYSIAYAREHS